MCATLFIIISNYNNDTICLILSCMFPLFSLQLLKKSDLEVLEFWKLSVGYFGLVFDWVYQIFKNSCTYAFSMESLSSDAVSTYGHVPRVH